MTKKIAISVPDDVAERLAREPNVSAYITEAVRGRMAGEKTREILRNLGFEITEEGIAKAREERERLLAAVTPETRAEAAKLYAQIMAGRARYARGPRRAVHPLATDPQRVRTSAAG